MQTLHLIRGISGSGKTTYAESLQVKVVEADQFFINQHGQYSYDRKQIKLSHQWCHLETRRLLMAGYDVAVANTFVKKWEMEFYFDLAKELNISVQIKICEGRYQNKHGVPAESIKRMIDKFECLRFK
jgi:predicted kinase